jgi:YD repeat-containing protein
MVYSYNGANQVISIRQYGYGELWGITDYQYDAKGRISRISDRDCDTCKNNDGYDLLIYNENAIRGIAAPSSGRENAVKISNIGNKVEISIADENLSIRSCKVILLDGKKVLQTALVNTAGNKKWSVQLPDGLGHTNVLFSVTLCNGAVLNCMIRNK